MYFCKYAQRTIQAYLFKWTNKCAPVELRLYYISTFVFMTICQWISDIQKKNVWPKLFVHTHVLVPVSFAHIIYYMRICVQHYFGAFTQNIYTTWAIKIFIYGILVLKIFGNCEYKVYLLCSISKFLVANTETLAFCVLEH